MGKLWINNSPVDLQGTVRQSFSDMVSKLPNLRGWLGLSAQRVKQLPGGVLQALSITSSIFLGIAKEVGAWIQAILELEQSMFLEPPIPKGNRWVEHIRNVYRDYGMAIPDMTQGATEAFTDYEIRLEGYAQDLIDVFRRQAITLDAIRQGLLRVLPAGTEITLVEPSTLVRPYPSGALYVARQLPGESSVDYQTRVSEYLAYWNQNKSLGSQANTLYPSPATSPVNLGSFSEGQTTDPSSLVNQRIQLLKSQLGGYTSLDGKVTKRYYSPENQGGILEITLGSDLPGAYDRLKFLKAAGVQVVVFVKQFLGTAVTTAVQSSGSFPDPNVLALVMTSPDTTLGLSVPPAPSAPFLYVP